MVVYKITNQVNGKVYIGKTVKKQLITRWREHVSEARRGNKSYLKQALRKYGFDKFTIETLYKASSEVEMNEKEKYFIQFYDSTDPNKGYNLTPGGDGVSWWTGKKRSPESVAKQVATRRAKGAYLTPNNDPKIAVKRVATRRANGNYQENVGRQNTPETIERMRIAASKRDMTPYIGRKNTPETIEKMRVSALNREQQKRQMKTDFVSLNQFKET